MGGDDPSNEAVCYPPPHGNTTVVVLSMVLGLGESQFGENAGTFHYERNRFLFHNRPIDFCLEKKKSC